MRANGSAALGHMSFTLQLALNLIRHEYLVYDAVEAEYTSSILRVYRTLAQATL
jgi:hypothetical protein